MAKLHLLGFLGLLFCHIVSCKGATYIVGDNDGWDISTDLDSWAKPKKFVVGDVLVFQYASYHSVSELTKEEFESCNTRNAVESSTSGNTSFPLTKAGDRYFSCGNRMHCLGGMKLQVHVLQPTMNNNGAPELAPTPAVSSSTSALPGTSKNGNPSLSSSAAQFIEVGRPFLLFSLSFLGYLILGGGGV